mgnify:CR=1 FL=1
MPEGQFHQFGRSGAGLQGLIVLVLLQCLVALLVKIESKGPVFYSQVRVGLDGKPFPMIKFRSMRIDAERHSPGWTTEDDPRRTPVGGFLRRFSLDELPQLFNVLLGEMSLDDLAGLLPESDRQLEELHALLEFPADEISALLDEEGLEGDGDELALRRDIGKDGRSRHLLLLLQ